MYSIQYTVFKNTFISDNDDDIAIMIIIILKFNCKSLTRRVWIKLNWFYFYANIEYITMGSNKTINIGWYKTACN